MYWFNENSMHQKKLPDEKYINWSLGGMLLGIGIVISSSVYRISQFNTVKGIPDAQEYIKNVDVIDDIRALKNFYENAPQESLPKNIQKEEKIEALEEELKYFEEHTSRLEN